MNDAVPDELDLGAALGQHLAWDEPSVRTARRAALARALSDSFEREVDPLNELSVCERALRAHHAKKAHYALLALRSSRVRQHCQTANPCLHDDHGGIDTRAAPTESEGCRTRLVGED